MPRNSFQEDLDALQADVVDLGELAVDRLRTGVEALEAGDREQARYVRDNDDDINERYKQLESECIDLFTLQQPVASDLRLVAATFKILTDLERVGDLAMNLGEYVLDIKMDLVPRTDLVDIGTLVADQVEAALKAYETADPVLAREVAKREEDVDRLCERVADLLVRDLVERDPGSPELRMESLLNEVYVLLLTLRDFERVGDHAVNIAARTLYMVENDDTLLY